MKRYLIIIILILLAINIIHSQPENVKTYRILTNENKIAVNNTDSSKILFAKFFSELKTNKSIHSFKYLFKGSAKLFNSLYSTYLLGTNLLLLFLTVSFTVLIIYIFFLNLKYTRTVLFKILPIIYNNNVNYMFRLIIKILYYIIYLAGGWLIISIFTFPLYKKKEFRKILILFVLALLPLIMIDLYPNLVKYPLKVKEMRLLKLTEKNRLNSIDLSFLEKNSFEFKQLKHYLIARYYEKNNTNNYNILNKIEKNYESLSQTKFYSLEISNNHAVSNIKLGNISKAEKILENSLDNQGESYITLYNLSQLYIVNNNIELAELYYSKSRTINKNIPDFNKNNPTFLINPIQNSLIFKVLLTDVIRQKESFPGFLYYVAIPFIIILIILILSFIISKFSTKYNSLQHCSSCNIPILPDSYVFQYSRNRFCPYCMNIIINPKYTNLITHGKKYINRNIFLKSFLINFFIPGGGLIYARSCLTGIIITFISLLLIIPVVLKDFIITHSYTDILIIENLYIFIPIFIIISNIIIFLLFKKRRLG